MTTVRILRALLAAAVGASFPAARADEPMAGRGAAPFLSAGVDVGSSEHVVFAAGCGKPHARSHVVPQMSDGSTKRKFDEASAFAAAWRASGIAASCTTRRGPQRERSRPGGAGMRGGV